MRGLRLLALALLAGAAGAAGDAIVGAGTALPAAVFADARSAYRFATPGVEVQYSAGESRAGICRLEAFAAECGPADTLQGPALDGVDFAASAVALNQSDYTKYPDIQMYPVLATAIVPVYNLNGPANLILSTTVLSQIFSGQIKAWDDRRIKSSNPNFTSWKVPTNQSIELVVLQDASDTTAVFKTALYSFSRTFANSVEVSGRPSWGNLTPTRARGPEALTSYVFRTPWTLGYAPFQHAVQCNVSQVMVSKSSGVAVQASLDSITFAVLEKGSSFGGSRGRSYSSGASGSSWSGGSSGSYSRSSNVSYSSQNVAYRLTADLTNARGDNAWPIVTYNYVVLRKSTLRAGATCDTVRATVAFWQWFLTATVIESVAQDHYFVQPPDAVRSMVVQRLAGDVTCAGQPVAQVAVVRQEAAAGEASVSEVLQQLTEVYMADRAQVLFSYAAGSLATPAAVAVALGANQFVAVRRPGRGPAAGTATLLFAGVALAVVSQYDLVLDVPTLARILEGDIRTWSHPALGALNPAGFQDPMGNNITNSSIVLFCGPTCYSDSFFETMGQHEPNFTGAALLVAQRFGTEQQLRTMVAGTPFTLGITTSGGEFGGAVKLARLRRPEGTLVAPALASILACASAAASYALPAGLDLGASADPACYPLSDTVYFVVRTPQCDRPSAAALGTESVAFLRWAFGADSLAAALEDAGLAPLATASPAVVAANDQALLVLSCTPAPGSSTDVVPIVVGACVGAFFLLLILVGWYVWKSSRDMRALRKQFSDVKVAEDCAEAIACFDLDAVSWLSNLTKPSKIQLAFLRIVNLLVEVKPFIPDQLLSQLQTARHGAEPALPPTPKRPRGSRDDQTLPSTHSRSTISSAASRPSSGFALDTSKRLDSKSQAPSEDSSGGRRAGRGPRVHPYGPPAGAGGPAPDRCRRTCTYMFVRFALDGGPEADPLGQWATAVAAHVVVAAKAHGATIDKVTYDSVALHWNVNAQAAGAPLQATALAMELACASQILPRGLQDDLRLLIGAGHGVCTVATVSAAGQRFFVVGGPEVTNAVEVVVREVALPLGCTILLSSALQQEVTYGFRCSPRLWYRDVLFWEPVEQRGGCKTDDEWMYQIRRMDEDDTAQDVGRALQEVFLLARSGQPGSALLAEVHRIQQAFAEALTPQDLASLRSLQVSCHPHSHNYTESLLISNM
eukprot:EG_transcript_328